MNTGTGEGAESASEYLFVYGSLRSDVGEPHAALLRGRARNVGLGRISGRLYYVDPYPAAVLSEEEGDWVVGEIYRVEDASVWGVLDEYEGCGEGLFRRERHWVVVDDGERVLVWVYLWARSVDGLRRILSGDYRQRS